MMNLTRAEVQRLLSAVDQRAPLGRRDYWLLVFLYQTGLRVGELVALDVSSVSLKGQPRQALQVRADSAKYGKSRLVPLNTTAQQAVAELLRFNRDRGFSTRPEAPLFVTKKHQRLSVRTVEWMVAELRDKAEIDFACTPHTLRHSHAAHLVARTGNLRAVQQLLGHRRLTSTEVYLLVRRDELTAVSETLAQPD